MIYKPPLWPFKKRSDPAADRETEKIEAEKAADSIIDEANLLAEIEIQKALYKKELIRKFVGRLAEKLQGVPYIWGGQNPWYGFDCSGFIIWLLQVFEVLPSGDWTAEGLRAEVTEYSDVAEAEIGDLVFYGKNNRANHVMMFIGDGRVIGASGGDSTTTSLHAANTRGAKVKVKAVNYRSDIIGYGRILK